MVDVTHSALTLPGQLVSPEIEAVVNFFDAVLCLFDSAFQTRLLRTALAERDEFGEGAVLTMKDRIEAGLNVPLHNLGFANALLAHLFKKGSEALF